MKRSKLFPALLAGTLLLNGCSAEKTHSIQSVPQKEITFSWWGNDTRNEYTFEVVKQFETLHPDIKVNCIYSEWSGYQTRYNIQMVSKTEADVMLINYAWIQKYSPDGETYYDLTQLSDTVDLSVFSEEDLNYGMCCGKLNALPIALNTQTLYVNQSVYAKYGLSAPKHWEDFFTAAKVMKGETYPIGMSAKSLWFFINSYVEQTTGKQFMAMDGSLHFSQEEYKQMIAFYCRLINEKVMPPTEYFDKLSIDSGNYAAAFAWISDAASYCGHAIENGYEIITADYITTPSCEVGEDWYAKPATMYAISSHTSHPAESALFLDFLINSQEAAILQGTEKGIPLSGKARQYLDESGMLEGIQYEAYQMMDAHKDTISIVSPYFENEDMINIFLEKANAVLYHKTDLDTASAELESEFRTLMQ